MIGAIGQGCKVPRGSRVTTNRVPSIAVSNMSLKCDQNGCLVSANLVIKGHNNLLHKRLDEIWTQYKDSMILYIDYYNAFTTILEKHTQYQFDKPFKACCGAKGGPFNYQPNLLCGAFGIYNCKNSSTHINFDGVHLTENMHLHLSDLFFNQGFCTPSFPNLIKKKKGQY